MIQVYVVSTGEYSDYYIVGIFESKEKAEEYINKICKEHREFGSFVKRNFEIEEFNINEGVL